MDNEQADKKPKHRLRRRLLISVLGLVLGFAAYTLTNAVTFRFFVVGDSMEPTVHDGEHGLGVDFRVAGRVINRGDIVAVVPTESTDELYCKRVIGLPGETVIIQSGKVFINGSDEPLDEPYLDGHWTKNDGPFCFNVPEGHYLVLGDNRNESYDARDWEDPYVPEEDIWANNMLVYWPLSHFRLLK